MQRKPQKDPVTPEVRERVMQIDMAVWLAHKDIFGPERLGVPTKVGCIASVLDPVESGPCSGPLTLDHVKDFPMMGKRAPSDERHLVTICLNHHVNTSWATSHRSVLRAYLREHRAPDDGAAPSDEAGVGL